MRLIMISLIGTWCLGAKAQDRIISLSNDTFWVTVLSLDSFNVTYRSETESGKNVYKVPNRKLRYIIYQNGRVDSFNYQVLYIKDFKNLSIDIKDTAAVRAYNQGYEDALDYFDTRGYTYASASTAFCCVGIGGVIVAGATCLTRVSEYKLRESGLYTTTSDPNYKKGFVDAATRKRNRRTWAGVAYGTGALIGTYAIVGIIVSSLSSQQF